MNTKAFNPTIHHRRSVRLPSYDYSSYGAYFITICTQNRLVIFENPDLLQILEDTWNTLPNRFPCVMLDEFVIMPDHVHFILWLKPDQKGIRPKLGDVVGAYKSITSVAWLAHIKAHRLVEMGRFWQKSFYEHVIKNDFELLQRRTYILNNPLKAQLKRDGQL